MYSHHILQHHLVQISTKRQAPASHFEGLLSRLRSLVRHHAGAVGPTQGAGLWLSAASLTEAGLRVLEKKSAVVQLLFQWVGTWCVHTLQYVALSDTMQERWDLCRARGCGYRQVRVPGASTGYQLRHRRHRAQYSVLDSSSAPKVEPTAGGTTPLTRQHRRRRVVGQPFVPSTRSYTTRSCWRKTRLLMGTAA